MQGGSVVPPLPTAVADEDIEVSDEDVEFVRKHKDYVGFLARLDTKSMNRYTALYPEVKLVIQQQAFLGVYRIFLLIYSQESFTMPNFDNLVKSLECNLCQFGERPHIPRAQC